VWNPARETFSAWLKALTMIVAAQRPSDAILLAIVLQRLEKGHRSQFQRIIDELGIAAGFDAIVAEFQEEIEGPRIVDPKTSLERSVEHQRDGETCSALWTRIHHKQSELGLSLPTATLLRIFLSKIHPQFLEVVTKNNLDENSRVKEILRVCAVKSSSSAESLEASQDLG